MTFEPAFAHVSAEIMQRTSSDKTLLSGGALHATFGKMEVAVGSGWTPGCESVEQVRKDSGHYPVVYGIPKVNLLSYNGTSTWILKW